MRERLEPEPCMKLTAFPSPRLFHSLTIGMLRILSAIGILGSATSIVEKLYITVVELTLMSLNP